MWWRASAPPSTASPWGSSSPPPGPANSRWNGSPTGSPHRPTEPWRTGGGPPSQPRRRHRMELRAPRPAAQRLMRRLAVFEGGWTVDAAEAVCAGDDLDRAAVPVLLADLAAASLVTFDPPRADTPCWKPSTPSPGPSGRRRRDLSRSVTPTSLVPTTRRHRRPRLVGSTTGDHVRRLNVEHPNLLAALRWALTDDRHPAVAAGLAQDLLGFWYTIHGGRDVTGLIGGSSTGPGHPPSNESSSPLAPATGDG